MKCKLNPFAVLDRCNQIIKDIEFDRNAVFEKEVWNLMNKRFFKRTRLDAVKEVKDYDDGGIYSKLPDWKYLYFGQYDHLSGLKNICQLLISSNIQEIELDNEDMRRLSWS